MIFPDIVELFFVGVFDRGISNKERIVFKTNTECNLAEYGVLLGLLQPNNLAAPYYDHLFTFPEKVVQANTWIFLYTGPGEHVETTMPIGEAALVYHWGKPYTVFAHSTVVPILFRIAAVQLLLPPGNRPQIEGKK